MQEGTYQEYLDAFNNQVKFPQSYDREMFTLMSERLNSIHRADTYNESDEYYATTADMCRAFIDSDQRDRSECYIVLLDICHYHENADEIYAEYAKKAYKQFSHSMSLVIHALNVAILEGDIDAAEDIVLDFLKIMHVDADGLSDVLGVVVNQDAENQSEIAMQIIDYICEQIQYHEARLQTKIQAARAFKNFGLDDAFEGTIPFIHDMRTKKIMLGTMTDAESTCYEQLKEENPQIEGMRVDTRHKIPEPSMN